MAYEKGAVNSPEYTFGCTLRATRTNISWSIAGRGVCAVTCYCRGGDSIRALESRLNMFSFILTSPVNLQEHGAVTLEAEKRPVSGPWTVPKTMLVINDSSFRGLGQRAIGAACNLHCKLTTSNKVRAKTFSHHRGRPS